MTTRGTCPSRIVVAVSSGCLAAAFAAVVLVVGDIGVMTVPRKESTDYPIELARARPPVPSSATPSIDANPLTDLRDRGLQLPLRGVTREALRDSFYETRGSTRVHEAIDILAPRNTPVVAVENGAIARLFYSKAGGITVYQFDPAVRFVYYYAHLERYADGLHEGDRVQRAQVLGYVGTSGNAATDTPHLHFAIFRLTPKKQWWQGSPIDPYEVFREP
jgi:murein DD-endopeptidase MepM/ murein hydrolase activator NlpD